MALQAEQTPARAVTGAVYDGQLSQRRSDRTARAAFRELVVHLAPPGATLLDFGSGTGTDARFYAERGFRVQAYDVDPDMCDSFEANCRNEIEAGRITLLRGTYESFLKRDNSAPGGTDLVASNFAPLNLLESLRDLFAAFYALTAPGGKVLASVLSPYFLGDLRYRWWWRNLPALVRDGRYSVAGAQGPIVRRGLADLAAQAEPFFVLERAYRDSAPPTPQAARSSWSARGLGTWLPFATCRYMFLQFARRNGVASHH